jgi:hypothetical protein
MKRAVGLLLVVSLVAGCSPGRDASTSTVETSTVPVETTTSPTISDFELRPREVAPFATLEPVPLLTGGSPYQGPEWPSTLDGVIRQPWTIPSEQAAAALLENAFVVVPSQQPLFHPVYQSYEAEEVWFVTTDVGYHYWHLAFDKVLREVETQVLLPTLEDLVGGMLEAARTQRSEFLGTELEEPADRVAQLFEAAATLLELDVGSIGPLAQAEVELATEAIDRTESPITSFGQCTVMSTDNCVDYTMFRPRGHYTRSADLERFFRAMSLLGQSSFFLGDPDAPDWDHRSLQLGLLAARLFAFDDSLGEAWATIYEPTAFMVGLADDYTPFELAETAEAVAPGVVANPSAADEVVLADIARVLLSSRDVGIDPEGRSVRIMGTRFLIDAYILDNLVDPIHRPLASALDVAAVLGSELALGILDEAGETNAPSYAANFDRMQELVLGRSVDDWAATVYDAWLYALQPMLGERSDRYPPMMQSPAWTVKDLQTALGSYAELKHDTILYAKQSYGAEGDFTPLSEPARHWVEPDPVAFGRLAAVTRLLHDGLATRDLIFEPQDRLLTDLYEMLAQLARLASDELEGRPITEADNDWLDRIGSTLESLWFQSADREEGEGDIPVPADMDAAIIADIQSSGSAYLEIGTGWVDRILVLVPNDEGAFQVATGAVYSFYEFVWPRSEQRLTDEEWRQMLGDSEEPPRPNWQAGLFPPETGGEGLLDLASGLFCRDLAAVGYRYPMAVAYWLKEGRPERMDADRNGTPCETVYDSYEVSSFFGRGAGPSGLFCRDLVELGWGYPDAVAYWLLEGAPDRMDADRNGVPCETTYDPAVVAAFLGTD